MTLKSAAELADYISLECRDAEVRTIANGESVVVLKDAQYWLWCMGDWLFFRQAQENKQARKAS